MSVNDRLKCLVETGQLLQEVVSAKGMEELNDSAQQELYALIDTVFQKNAWFSPWSVRNALTGISEMLNSSDITEWASRYYKNITRKENQNTIGIVMAGNLPLVGFHDLISVFLAGDKAQLKLSSDDKELMPVIIKLMSSVDSRVNDMVTIANEKLEGIDKVIATGSNNTARYFEYYFGKYPNIIRKSRTSLAILSPSDSEDDIDQLAEDIFYYYGLGCRNVSKIYLPKSIGTTHFIDVLSKNASKLDNVKYINNLEYHKSIMLINNVQFLDGGFFFMKEDNSLFSPVSVLNYEFYDDIDSVQQFVQENKNDIQCVVGNASFCDVSFGQAQHPKLWDYADKVDVLQFLLNE